MACDGEGAESFQTLFQRSKAALDRLEALPAEPLVYVFRSQTVHPGRAVVGWLDAELSDREKVRKFWGKGSPAIANTERIELRIEDGFWLHKTAVQPAALTV